MLKNLDVVVLLMAGILFIRLQTTTETAPPNKQNLIASVLEKIKEQHCHAVTYEFNTGTPAEGRAGLGCTLAAGHATSIQIQ